MNILIFPGLSMCDILYFVLYSFFYPVEEAASEAATDHVEYSKQPASDKGCDYSWDIAHEFELL